MDKSNFNIWAEKFGTAWANLDPEGALAMLSKDIKYFESNFTPACSSWDEVVSLWKIVPTNQKDVSFKHEVMLTEKDMGIIRWQVSRTLIPANKHQDIDGIFLVKLNEDGLCTMFRQWRSVKE